MKLTIGKKLFLGFGIILFALVINAVVTLNSSLNNSKLNNQIQENYNPSTDNLGELRKLLVDSKMLIKNWVYIEKQSDTPDKTLLIDILNKELPSTIDELKNLSNNWSKENQDLLQQVDVIVKDSIIPMQNLIMEQLNSFESYDDIMIMFNVMPLVEEQGELIVKTNNTINILDNLIKTQTNLSNSLIDEMQDSFQSFPRFVIITTLIIIIISIIVLFYVNRSITVPIKKGVEFCLNNITAFFINPKIPLILYS